MPLCLRSLEGKLPGSGGKGAIDILIMKASILEKLLSEVVDEMAWALEIKQAIRTTCANHTDFRSKMGYPDDLGGVNGPDLTFRAGWPPSAEQFLQIIEARHSKAQSPTNHVTTNKL